MNNSDEKMSACELLKKFHFLANGEKHKVEALRVAEMHASNACREGKYVAPTDTEYLKKTLTLRSVTPTSFSSVFYISKQQLKDLQQFRLQCSKTASSEECNDEVQRMIYRYNNCPQSDA